MTLSPHEKQLKAKNPYAKGMPAFKHSFEVPNTGQVMELSEWLAQYDINFSIYPVSEIILDNSGRKPEPVLLVAFNSEDELASMFVLRWLSEANKG